MTTLGGLDWCGVAVGLGCCCWQCNRCLKFGADDSKGWLEAGPEEVKDLLYYAQLNLAAYAESVAAMDERTSLVVSENVLNFVGDKEHRRAPPYFLYINHEKKDIALIFRGLNMASKKDLAVLMRKKHKRYNHGYVHGGMLKAAQWALRQEERILKKHCTAHPDYTLTIVGHSLGAGIASLLCVLLHDKPSKVGIEPLDKNRIRAVCFAPPRVISRNHVANYSHAIRGVVLQDDFFSRVSTSVVQHIFLGFTGVWLAGILTQACLSDFFVSSTRRLRDPARLYPPGKLYHIVYKKPWHCGKVAPRVVTATPTGGRFEKLILSLTATSDHHIRNYNKFLCQALQGLGFEGPAAETQLAAPVESIDRQGMSVEEEGKARDYRAKQRPRRSYEITLEGTSSNVERYAEETASIGREEGEDERRGERNDVAERNGRNGKDGLDVASKRGIWNGIDGLERENGNGVQEEFERKDCNGGDERNERNERNGSVHSTEWERTGVRSEKTDRRGMLGKIAERDAREIWEEVSYPVEITEAPGARCGRAMPPKPPRRKALRNRDETRLAPAASNERWGGELVRQGSSESGESGETNRPGPDGVDSPVRGAREELVQPGAVGRTEGAPRATLESSMEGPGLKKAGSGESSGFEIAREGEKGGQTVGLGFWKRWFRSTGGSGDNSNCEQLKDSEKGRNENGGENIDSAASLGGKPQWEGVSRRHGGSIDSEDSHWETICLQL